MAQAQLTTAIRVRIERHGNHYIAYSDDLPGLNLIGNRQKDVLADVPSAVAYLYKANAGVDVSVCQMAKPLEFPNPVYEKDRFVVSAQAAFE
ncbi:MAG: hypothetical protein OXF68_15060 [Gammaproteobacteria bacterium]|nr:hypothetical protein [Gammaproteobacteria bacterium]